MFQAHKWILLSTTAQTPSERIIPTLSPQNNALPSLTPTIHDDSAPDPQKCPGYKASNVATTSSGFTVSGQDDDDSSSALTTIAQFYMGWLVMLLPTTFHC
jgi:hypothetical protein